MSPLPAYCERYNREGRPCTRHAVDLDAKGRLCCRHHLGASLSLPERRILSTLRLARVPLLLAEICERTCYAPPTVRSRCAPRRVFGRPHAS